MVPKLPQPCTLLVEPAVVAATHSPLAFPCCRVAKKTWSLANRTVAGAQVSDSRTSSAASRHTCHPSAHRSAAEQPTPAGSAPLFPAWRAHCGVSVLAATNPGVLHAPEQAAIAGWSWTSV